MSIFVKSPGIAVTLLLVIVFIAASAHVFAQVNDEEKIRVDTNLVLINVLVRDKKGELVTGLAAEQFEIFDEKIKQPIENFSAGEASVSFGIVYDMHPTSAERTKSVVESLRQFSRELKFADDVFLVAFNMRGQQTFDFIPTLEQLEKHTAYPVKREPYSLYDAIYFASERLQSSRNQKRVLLIISDSADHSSRHTFSEVRQKVGDVRAEVYAVIFDMDNDMGYADLSHTSRESYPFSKDASRLDRAAILDLTLKSGGGTYFGVSQNALRLLSIYKQIASEMRAHYTLGFYPDVVDGKRHNIRIRLRGVEGSKNFALTYKPSYQNRAKPGNQ